MGSGKGDHIRLPARAFGWRRRTAIGGMQNLVECAPGRGAKLMATLPEIVNWLEGDDSLHLGRLLVLLGVFGGRSDRPIEGLTKLGNLDFLLRYPVYLERGLIARNAPDAAAEVEDYERH